MAKSKNPFSCAEENPSLCRMISTKHLPLEVMQQMKMWFSLQSLPRNRVLFDVFTLANNSGFWCKAILNALGEN